MILVFYYLLAGLAPIHADNPCPQVHGVGSHHHQITPALPGIKSGRQHEPPEWCGWRKQRFQLREGERTFLCRHVLSGLAAALGERYGIAFDLSLILREQENRTENPAITFDRAWRERLSFRCQKIRLHGRRPRSSSMIPVESASVIWSRNSRTTCRYLLMVDFVVTDLAIGQLRAKEWPCGAARDCLARRGPVEVLRERIGPLCHFETFDGL